MELDEFDVRHCCAGSQRHGDSVTGGLERVGGHRKQLTGATGSQQDVAGTDLVDDAVVGRGPHPDAHTAFHQKVEGKCVFMDHDCGAAHRGHKSTFDLGTGRRTSGMNDSGQRMASLAGQFETSLLVAVEGGTQSDEILHAPGAFLDENAHRIDVTETVTGGKGVGQMQIGRIRIAPQYRGNAALCPSSGCLFKCALREDSDPQPVAIGGPDRGGETGDTGAHNQKIEFSGLDHSSTVLRARASRVAPCRRWP